MTTLGEVKDSSQSSKSEPSADTNEASKADNQETAQNNEFNMANNPQFFQTHVGTPRPIGTNQPINPQMVHNQQNQQGMPNTQNQQSGPQQMGQMNQNPMMMRIGNGMMPQNMYFYQMQMFQQGQKGMPMPNMQPGMSRFMPQYNAYLNRVQSGPMQQQPQQQMLQQQMMHQQMLQHQQQQASGDTKKEEGDSESKIQPVGNNATPGAPQMMPNPMHSGGMGMPMMNNMGTMGNMYYGPRLLVNNAIDSIPSLRLANSQFQNVTQVLDALASQTRKRRAPRSSRDTKEDSDFKNVLQDYFSASDNSDDEYLVSRSLRVSDGSNNIRRSNRTRTKTIKYDEFNDTESDTQEDYLVVNNTTTNTVKSNRGRKKGVTYKRPAQSKQVNPYSRNNFVQFDESSDDSPQYGLQDLDPNNTETSGLSLRNRKQRVNYAELEYSDEEDEDHVEYTEDDVTKNQGGIDRVVTHRVMENGEWEYLIKWQGFAHIHNTWDTYDNLKEFNGIRRLDNYIKRFKNLEERQKYMTLDEIEQENIALGLQKQIDEDALIAERIVTHYRDENGVMVYLVKWRSCPYDQCTEEEEETLIEHGFLHLIQSYKIREDRIMGEAASRIPRNTRSISATRFEPYYETPSYLCNPTYLEEMGYTSRLYFSIMAENARREEEAKAEKSEEESKQVKGVKLETDGESLNVDTKHKFESVTNDTNRDGMNVATDVNGGLTKEVSSDIDDIVNKKELKGDVIDNKMKNESDSDKQTDDQIKKESDEKGVPPVRKYNTRESALQKNTFKVAFERRKLRDYQLTGLNWMVNRMKRGLSVLLADEMGLGKTVQTISLVGHFMYKEYLVGPYLIIVPQSTIDNWMREFENWLPQANVVCYYGNAVAREMIRQRELCIVSITGGGERYKCDVCITTPSIINSPVDLDFLRKISWQLMVVDEAHQLKNKHSKRFIELMHFMADNKLLLSGTPLHNNLEELWTLLHFINPQLYTYYEDFRRRYSEIENPAAIGENKRKQLASLQHELQQFVLRRVKKDVEKSLPNKVERILRVELSPMQIEWYKNILARNYDELARNSGGSRSSLQNICMELKKVCNHPFLCYEPDDRQVWLQGLIYGSGKICLLDKLLQRLKEKGHRVLIFSQMVRMLNIISEYLTLRGFKHQRLDGTMGKEVRKKAMDHFNDPSSDDFCFLLSTKAGGLGINLTSADTVIIYDSDWNPQNDLQAEARAHRIGQTKTVQIYRLVTKDSIEQTILERAKTKMVLDALVVQGLNKRGDAVVLEDSKSGFSREELAKILKFGASKLWATANPQSNKTVSSDDKLDIDLDKVLQEAELSKENDTDLAQDLLSSYTNITEFRYEPPEGKLEISGENDKDFWEATIPLEERVKLKKKKQEELLVNGPRRTRAKDTGTIETDDYSDDEADADFQPRKTTKEILQAQEGTKGKRGQRRSRKVVLTVKDKMKIHRSLSKFGVPELRLKEIHNDCKLTKVDPRVILNECQNMIDICKSKMKTSVDDEDKRARRSQMVVEIGEIKLNAQDFLDKMKLLESLEQFGRSLSGNTWNTTPSDEFNVPQQVFDQMNDGKEKWTSVDIMNLLKLINKYGFGYWTHMCSDKTLCVGILKDIKHDRLKSRALKLLKIVNTYIDPTSIILLADEKRISVPKDPSMPRSRKSKDKDLSKLSADGLAKITIAKQDSKDLSSGMSKSLSGEAHFANTVLTDPHSSFTSPSGIVSSTITKTTTTLKEASPKDIGTPTTTGNSNKDYREDEFSDIYTLDNSEPGKGGEEDIVNLLNSGKLTTREHYANAVKHVLKPCRDVLRIIKRLRNPEIEFQENLRNFEFAAKAKETAQIVKNSLEINLKNCPDETVAIKVRLACWKFVSKIIQSDQFPLETYA